MPIYFVKAAIIAFAYLADRQVVVATMLRSCASSVRLALAPMYNPIMRLRFEPVQAESALGVMHVRLAGPVAAR